MSYFEQLQHDWDSLGLYEMKRENALWATVRPEDVESYSDLHAMLHGLAQNVYGADYHHAHLRDKDPETLGLQTELAKHAVSLFNLDVLSRIPMSICGQADSLLARTMTPERITNPEKDSPIIVTRGDTAIGIVKQLGDINYYALESDTETATHEGHLYRLNLHTSLFRPFLRGPLKQPSYSDIPPYVLQADHAFTLPAEEIQQEIHKGTQFTSYMVPTSARVNLQVTDRSPSEAERQRVALRTTHKELRDIAADSLATAEQIHRGYRFVPGREPKGWKEILIDGKYELVKCES
jgi:hypothetical protein